MRQEPLFGAPAGPWTPNREKAEKAVDAAFAAKRSVDAELRGAAHLLRTRLNLAAVELHRALGSLGRMQRAIEVVSRADEPALFTQLRILRDEHGMWVDKWHAAEKKHAKLGGILGRRVPLGGSAECGCDRCARARIDAVTARLHRRSRGEAPLDLIVGLCFLAVLVVISILSWGCGASTGVRPCWPYPCPAPLDAGDTPAEIAPEPDAAPQADDVPTDDPADPKMESPCPPTYTYCPPDDAGKAEACALLAQDPLNCGACGVVCTGGCSAGVCR